MVSVRVSVIADDPVLRDRLIGVIHLEPGCRCLGLPYRPAAWLALRSAAADVVLIDHGMNGARALCSDLSTHTQCGVIMVGVPDDGDAAVDALSAGARGVIYKTQPIADVPKAVHIVHKGLVWAPRHIVAATWLRFRAEMTARPRAGELEIAERLSSREREVFRHAAIGLGNKEVATRLSISESTVKVHLTHIFQKLGLRGRGELAAAYFGILR